PSEPAQVRSAAGKGSGVAEEAVLDRFGRVDLEQAEARGAEMNPVDGPIAEARHPERAAVADATAEDAPGVREIAPVLPHGPQHLEVVVRLRRADAERHGTWTETGTQPSPPPRCCPAGLNPAADRMGRRSRRRRGESGWGTCLQ